MTLPTVQQYGNWLRAQLGKTEHPIGSNCQEFASIAHHANCHPWCATLLVAGARRTGLILPSYSAYTPTLASAFKAQGRYGSTPRVGAFGFVYHPELGRIAHAFWVEAVYSNHYTLGINGNSNDDGSRAGYKVCRVKRSPYHITFGYPRYATSTTTSTTHPNPYAVPVLGSRPYISRTSKKTTIETKYIQWAAGGPAYDDGSWGDVTERIVRAFQDHHGLGVDGRVGPATLRAMAAVRR